MTFVQYLVIHIPLIMLPLWVVTASIGLVARLVRQAGSTSESSNDS